MPADFATFVLSRLPAPPARVIEVGCGDRGGLVPVLADAGYEVVGVDPNAPEGERYVQADFRDVDGTFDAAVAGRVLHHVHPLGPALDHLASLAPLLLVDEFACDLIDPELQAWYEARHRELAEPRGPASLDEWREHHPDLHPHGVVLAALRARYHEQTLEWAPYLHRWLGDVVESPDRIGYLWAGLRTSTTRSSASAR